MKHPAQCPNCQSRNQFKSAKPQGGGGGHAPNYLLGLGRWYRAARFETIICRDCGLTRFFAEEEALEKLQESKNWVRL